MHEPTPNGAHVAAGSQAPQGLGLTDPAKATTLANDAREIPSHEQQQNVNNCNQAREQANSQLLVSVVGLTASSDPTWSVNGAPPADDASQTSPKQPKHHDVIVPKPEPFHGQPVADAFEIVAETVSTGPEQAPEQLIVHRASDEWPGPDSVATTSTSTEHVHRPPKFTAPQLEILADTIANQSTTPAYDLSQDKTLNNATRDPPSDNVGTAWNVGPATSEDVAAAPPFVPQNDVAVDIELLQATLPALEHPNNDTASVSAPSSYSMDLSVDDDDDDSALGDILSSRPASTGSVTSSIYHFVEEFGRTYHRYKEGKYFLPNDEEEQNRLGTCSTISNNIQNS